MSTTLDPVKRLDSQNTENSVTDQLVSQEVHDSVASKTSTDEVPEVKSFVKLNGKTKTVKLSDDTVINLSDVAYNSDGVGLLIEGIADMGVNSATANTLMKNYTGDHSVTDVSNYLNDVKRAYNAGLINYPLNRMSQFSKHTNEAQVLTAWKAGEIQAKFNAAPKPHAKVKAAGLWADGKKTTAKDVIKEHSDLNEMQKVSVEVLERLSDALDLRIELYESEEVNGRRIGDNGSYDNGTIRIDLYAGETGSGTMLRVASHEMVHMIKDYSNSHFKTLADFVLKNYADRGVDVDELVKRQQMIAQDKLTGKSALTYDEAFEEVVADSLERMLTDTDALVKIEELARQNKGLVQKMASYFKDKLAKIKKIYDSYDGDSYAVRNGLQDIVNEFQKLSDVFAEGIVNASKNAHKNTTAKKSSGEVKHSIRENFYKEYDAWDKKNPSITFVIGRTSNVLNDIGVKDQEIMIISGKILRILDKHPEMSHDIIKKIPQLLENPILVQFSNAIDEKTGKPKYESRISVLGELNGLNGNPILVSIELLPTNQQGTSVLDMQVITSAYEKKQLQHYINSNDVLWVNPNEKKTSDWLTLNRLQLPVGVRPTGLIRRIAYSNGKVKLENSQHKTPMEMALEKAGVVDEFGEVKHSRREGDGFIRTYNQRDKVTNSLEKRLNEKYSYKNPHYVDGIPVTFDSIHKSDGMGSLATFYVNMTIGDESDNAESFTIRYSGHESRYGDYDRSIQNKDIKSLDDLYNAVDEVIADYVNELPDWQREELRNEFAEQAQKIDGNNPNIRRSRREGDYLKAVENNDEKTAQQLVDETAKESGYNSPRLYHGTSSFGFTQFDLSKMDDKRSIFLTSSEKIASTYSGVDAMKRIHEKNNIDVDKLSIEDVVKLMNDNPPDSTMDYSYSYITDIKAFKNKVTSEVNTLSEMLSNISRDSLDEQETRYINSIEYAIESKEYIKLSTPLYILNDTELFKNDKAFIRGLEQDVRALNAIQGIGSNEVIIEKALGGYSIEAMPLYEARTQLKKNINRGNYSLYAKLENPFVIDAAGKNWNDIFAVLEPREKTTFRAEYDHKTDELVLSDNKGEFDRIKNDANDSSAVYSVMSRAIFKRYGTFFAANIFAKAKDQLRNSAVAEVPVRATGKFNTRDISEFAQKEGYDSVIFKNLRDNGGMNHKVDPDTKADIYIVFDPNNIKSADPVTYDDEGNIVPLSERFNDEKNDIRFSRRDYSYEALIKKPDMKITTVDDEKSYHTQTTRKDIVNQALKNAVQFGSQNENGNVVINVDDIGTDVILSKNGLRHGLDTRLDELAPITLKAGEILKNSIRINELLPRKEYISNTYVLIGAAKDSSNNPYVVDFVVNKATNEVTSVDVLYSINKKEPTGTKSPSGYANIAPYFTGSEISISKLLDAVNLTFPDILPEDVLRHYDYTERPEGSLGNSAMFSRRDYSFSKALTSAEWKKYNNSIMTGVDAGLRINENSTLVECEDGDFEYKYVIYDNETEDKNILAVYGLRTNYEKATAREIAEYLYKLEEQGYADERITKKIYNSIGKNYGALLGKYNRENSRFTRTRRWDNSSGEANGEGSSGETISEGVKHSRRDQYARDLKREFKYTDTVENVSKKLDDIEELQRSANTSSDYQAAYDSAKNLAENIINNGQVIVSFQFPAASFYFRFRRRIR